MTHLTEPSNNFGLEHAPLFNIEAEEAILGAILLDPAAIEAALSLPPEAFSLTAHQIIFKAMRSLHEEGKPTDLISVTSWLLDRRRLAEIGGQSKLATLVERTVSGATIKSDIDLVLEKYSSRLLQGIGSDLAAGRISLQEAKKALDEISQPGLTEAEQLEQELRKVDKLTGIARELALAKLATKTKIRKETLEAEIVNLSSKTANRKPEVVDWKDMLNDEGAAIQWLIPGLIPKVGVFLLAGASGSGKTTLTVDVAGALLCNEEFLGEKPTKKRKVLIVAADENPRYTRDKLIERGIPEDAELKVIKNWNISKWNKLEETVASFKPDLVAVDCLASIHCSESFDENSAQAKSTIYKLDALSGEYDCCVFLLHHLSKNPDAKGLNKIRGSSAITAACSTVAILERPDKSEVCTLTFYKMRGNGEIYPQYNLGLDRTIGRYTVQSGGADHETKSVMQRMQEFFHEQIGKRFEFSEIRNVFAASEAAIYKGLNRLTQRGIITKQKSKVDGKFNVWGLLEDSPPPVPLQFDCLTSETQLEQELQTLDNTLDNIGHTLDTQKCPISETQLQQELQTLDTNTGQGGGVSPEQLSSTDLKWLLSLLSDMEHSKEVGTAHPRFASSDHVVQQFNKAERKAALCKDSLLSACSDYWERLSNATASLFEQLAEAELPEQLCQPGES